MNKLTLLHGAAMVVFVNIRCRIVVGFLVSFLFACDSATAPPPPDTPTPCHDYSKDSTYQGDGWMYPALRYKEGKVSSDGKTLAYLLYDTPNELGEASNGKLYFCDLTNGKQSTLPMLSWQDGVRYHGIRSFEWCPYDPNLLVVDVTTRVDTSGDINNAAITTNSYIINRQGQVILRVTPPIYPWYGSSEKYKIEAWSPGSSTLADSLVCRGKDSEYIIYIPNNNSIVKPYYYPFAYSMNGKYWYGTDDISIPPARNANYLINGKTITFEEYGMRWIKASLSPSGQYLAIEGITTPGITYNELTNVWICDIDAWMKNPTEHAPIVNKLSFRRDFCTYTGYEIDPVFLTDTTLAVSMYPAFGYYSHYHEVGIYGTYIRQLSGNN